MIKSQINNYYKKGEVWMRIFLASIAFMLFLSVSVGIAAEKAETAKEPYPLTTCVVSGQPLESMGGGIDYDHEGTLVKFCCQGCIGMFQKDPAKYLAILEKAKADKKSADNNSQ